MKNIKAKEIINIILDLIKKHYISIVQLTIALFIVYLQFSKERPSIIQVGNIGERSLYVSWITGKQNRSCLFAHTDKFNQFRFACESINKTRTHLLEIKNLTPDTNYSIYIISGTKTTKYSQKVKTITQREEAPQLPEPAYGVVVDEEGVGIPGAIVTISPATPEYHHPVITETNSFGNFSVDISPIMYKADKLFIRAVGNLNLDGQQLIDQKIHAPFPPIRVEKTFNE
ncbi:hypothetical protein ACFL1M_00935 [Patescibacteria group bacterium]